MVLKVKKGALIPLRNLIITLLVMALILVCVEAVLAFKGRKTEQDISALNENPNIQLLQSERSLADGTLFMASINAHSMSQNYSGLTVTPEFKKGYPLLNINNKLDNDDAFNIVVIGDSFVWGASSLNRNELFWRVLENDFRKEGKNVNVFGVGMSAANAYEELSWLTDYSLVEDLDPDLVVFGYVYNDPDDSVVIPDNSINWDKELSGLKNFKKLFPNVYNALVESIAAKTMYTDKFSDSDYMHYDGAPPVLKGRFYEKYKTDFVKKLDAYAETADFSIAVVTLPTLPNNSTLERLYEPLEELYAQCENVDFYNCIDEYNSFASSKHSKNYQVNSADFHPGSATNRFYADYIRDFVEKDFGNVITDLPENYDDITVKINDYLPYGISPQKIFEDEKTVKYEITYPSMSVPYDMFGIKVSDYYLFNPLGKPYIKLCFSQDVNLSQIRTQGQYENIELHYTRLNDKLNYDDHEVFDFVRADGDVFNVDKEENITAVLVSADFPQGKDRKIELTLTK